MEKQCFKIGIIFFGHTNYQIYALKVISCAPKLIKFTPRKIESGKLFKMHFYDNNTNYIIILKYYFDARQTGLVSTLKT